MPEALIWINGERSGELPLPDRGLAYGDGLFETLLLVDGKAVLPELHAARLALGLQRLYFPVLDGLLEQVLDTVGPAAPAGCAVLRLTVTRGTGPRGYASPRVLKPCWIAELSPYTQDPRSWQAPARLGLAALRLARQPALAGIKHLNRLEQVLAARSLDPQRFDDLLMEDEQGLVTATLSGNLFVVRAGQLLTPRVDQCGVAGTRREAIMRDWAPALGLSVRERNLSLADVKAADEVFYCNALRGVRAVASLQERCWQHFPLTRQLHEHYCTYLEPGSEH